MKALCDESLAQNQILMAL